MALTCPRCGTAVPSEALYCPYCTLPKPKRGFAAAENKPEQNRHESGKPPVALKGAKTFTRAKKGAPSFPKPPTGRPRKKPPSRGLRVGVLSVAALVALVGVGAYMFVVPMVYSEHAEPKTVLSALDKLRKTPSNEPGLTVDAILSRELETARRVGNLVAYQGWVVRPVKGTKTKVVLAFSYEEVGNVSQNAEWIADLRTGVFIPQTDLAAKVTSTVADPK